MSGLSENFYKLKNSVKIGDISELKKFVPDETGINPIGEFFRIACEFGHLEIVEYLFNIQLQPGKYIIDKHVTLETGEIIFLPGSYCSLNLGFYIASKNGHIHIIKFLIKFIKTFEKIMQFTIQETASRGHFEIIKILIDNNFPFGRYTVSNAIKYEHYKLAKYLIVNANVPQAIEDWTKLKEITDELDSEISEILDIGPDIYSIISEYNSLTLYY